MAKKDQPPKSSVEERLAKQEEWRAEFRQLKKGCVFSILKENKPILFIAVDVKATIEPTVIELSRANIELIAKANVCKTARLHYPEELKFFSVFKNHFLIIGAPEFNAWTAIELSEENIDEILSCSSIKETFLHINDIFEFAIISQPSR